MFSIEKANASDPKLQEVFESGRPLYSTLLNLEELQIKSTNSYIRSYYEQATLEKENETIKEEIRKTYPHAKEEKLLTLQQPSELNAFAKKLKKSQRSKASLTKNLGLEEACRKLFTNLNATFSNSETQNKDEIQGKTTDTESIQIPAFFEKLVDDQTDEIGTAPQVEKLITSYLFETLNDEIAFQHQIWKHIETSCLVKTTKAEKTDNKSEDSKYKSFHNFSETYQNLLKTESALKYLQLRRGVSQGDLQL